MIHRISFPFRFGILFISLIAEAQVYQESYLMNQSYDSLISFFNSNKKDTTTAIQISRAYLKKARIDDDSTKMARAYERLSNVSEYTQALRYLDSSIYLSRNSLHPNYPAAPYLFKSYYQYNVSDYEESLNNAILGYQHAKRKGNIRFEIYGLGGISKINSLWGNNWEALNTEFLKLKLYWEHPELEVSMPNFYSYTLSSIGTGYTRLRMPDSALVYFEKAIVESLRRNDSAMYFNLVQRTGAALYFKGDYQRAKDSLNKGFKNRLDSIDYSTYPFYIGSILLKKGAQKKGIAVFEEIDATYRKEKVLYPELILVYKTLSEYYKREQNLKLHLKYLSELIVVDSLVDEMNRYIKDKTTKDYEIPMLLNEREELIHKLEARNKVIHNKLSWVLAFLGISLIGLAYYMLQRRIYRRRFDRLISGIQRNKKKLTNSSSAANTNGISSEIVKRILDNLDNFEEGKQFLSQEVTMQGLAKVFKTNPNYLSKVINSKKGMSFASYINNLRVIYSAKELRENTKLRKYSIRGISEESGFKTAESFSKAFYKKYGLYPSYFIKQLENN
ncbi:MAG: AraC family transcriptional regulator [Flavobacteriaceae bacterium]|nr:AraC family transcriptional regulator [Flavobacteriaceae bacterium]